MIRTLIARFLAWHRAINACQTCNQREGTNLDCPEGTEGCSHPVAARFAARASSGQELRETLERREATLRNTLSHATGGSFSDIDASSNTIGVEISKHHNAIWKAAQDAALARTPDPVASELVARFVNSLTANGANPDNMLHINHDELRAIISDARATQAGIGEEG